MTDLNQIRFRLQSLGKAVSCRIRGQSEIIDKLLIGFSCGGHILLEGLPGLAKTTTVRLLAQGLGLDYNRIQMTPDFMPGDILGSSFLKQDLTGFIFQPGPIFCNILLVDELNRAPAKVQSALLEAMQESQITAGGQTHLLKPVFWVVATQNPIDQEGTYPLAESQKDRFLMRLNIAYPMPDAEVELLKDVEEPLASPLDAVGITESEILELRQGLKTIYCADVLSEWVAKVLQCTRSPSIAGLDDRVLWGVSPRGGRMWIRAAKARAWWLERNYVIPEDLYQLADDVLHHRIVTDWSMPTGVNDQAGSLVHRIIEKLGPP